MRQLLQSLYIQVLLAMVIGVLLGYFLPEWAVRFKPIADAFIGMLKMLIPMLVFFAIVSGINSISQLSKVGKVAGYATGYFLVMGTGALILGVAISYFFRPGDGFAVDLSAFNPAAITPYLQSESSGLFPSSFFMPFVDGNILHIIMLAGLFGVALGMLRKEKQVIAPLINASANTFFKIMDFILVFAPLSGFAAIAFAVGHFGLGILVKLLLLVICFYVASFIFIVVILGVWLKLFCGISVFKLIYFLRDEVAIVLATASSGSVLAPLIEKLEALGVHPDVVRLVLPMGGSFNLDGSEIYIAMTALFIAQAFNIDLSLHQIIILVGMMVVLTKGTAPVTGGAVLSLATVLLAFQVIPVEGILLVLGIDRFLGEGRALTNMLSNAIAVLFVAQHLGQWDKKRGMECQQYLWSQF